MFLKKQFQFRWVILQKYAYFTQCLASLNIGQAKPNMYMYSFIHQILAYQGNKASHKAWLNVKSPQVAEGNSDSKDWIIISAGLNEAKSSKIALNTYLKYFEESYQKEGFLDRKQQIELLAAMNPDSISRPSHALQNSEGQVVEGNSDSDDWIMVEKEITPQIEETQMSAAGRSRVLI